MDSGSEDRRNLSDQATRQSRSIPLKKINVEGQAHRTDYVQEQYPSYLIPKPLLESHLTRIFGSLDFQLEARNDLYYFMIPRPFTEEEKEDLRYLRRYRLTSTLDIAPEEEDTNTRRRPRRAAEPIFEHSSGDESTPPPPEIISTSPENRPVPAPEIVSGVSESEIITTTCRICTSIYLLWLTVASTSLAVGLWRSFATGDEGKGFTDAAYVVAVGGLIVFPIQNRHNQRCRLA